MMKHLISLLMCLLLCSGLQAQTQGKSFPLKIGIFTHSIDMPFHNPIKRPLNWGISVGTILWKKEGKFLARSLDVDLAWYRHKELGQALMLSGSTALEYVHSSGFRIGPAVSIGYLHTFTEKELFEVNEQGVYEKVTDVGRPSFVFGFGATIGMDLGKSGNLPLRPFLSYMWRGQMPHSQFVSLFPHNFFSAGAVYDLPAGN